MLPKFIPGEPVQAQYDTWGTVLDLQEGSPPAMMIPKHEFAIVIAYNDGLGLRVNYQNHDLVINNESTLTPNDTEEIRFFRFTHNNAYKQPQPTIPFNEDMIPF